MTEAVSTIDEHTPEPKSWKPRRTITAHITKNQDTTANVVADTVTDTKETRQTGPHQAWWYFVAVLIVVVGLMGFASLRKFF